MSRPCLFVILTILALSQTSRTYTVEPAEPLAIFSENTFRQNCPASYKKPEVLANISNGRLSRLEAPLTASNSYRGINREVFLVVQCESNWNNDARGKSGEIGLAQFMPSTWNKFCKMAGFDGDIYSAEDQLWLVQWAFENSLQHHWTCWRRLFGS